jgi:hypothetical protein
MLFTKLNENNQVNEKVMVRHVATIVRRGMLYLIGTLGQPEREHYEEQDIDYNRSVRHRVVWTGLVWLRIEICGKLF